MLYICDLNMKSMKKGCNYCEYYEPSKMNFDMPDTPRYCRSGRKDAFENWWKINGHKTDKETLTEMSCFEESKLGQMVDELKFLSDKLNELVENKK